MKSMKGMKVQCCVCRRIRHGWFWRRTPEQPDVVYSHGFCPACARETMRQWEAEAVLAREVVA